LRSSKKLKLERLDGSVKFDLYFGPNMSSTQVSLRLSQLREEQLREEQTKNAVDFNFNLHAAFGDNAMVLKRLIQNSRSQMPLVMDLLSGVTPLDDIQCNFYELFGKALISSLPKETATWNIRVKYNGKEFTILRLLDSDCFPNCRFILVMIMTTIFSCEAKGSIDHFHNLEGSIKLTKTEFIIHLECEHRTKKDDACYPDNDGFCLAGTIGEIVGLYLNMTIVIDTKAMNVKGGFISA
jgi:hypothetical protein